MTKVTSVRKGKCGICNQPASFKVDGMFLQCGSCFNDPARRERIRSERSK